MTENVSPSVGADADLRRLRGWIWLAIVLIFLPLGWRGLAEPDEGRYAEAAREMLSTGDWLVPHVNGFEHFTKPPVIYWLGAAAMRIFGINEFAARLPSALAAAGVVLLLRSIGARLFGPRAGLIAALVMAGMAGFFAASQLVTPDMTLTFWCVAAVYALVRHRDGDGRKWGWWFFVFMGLGFLTKGPLALLVPLGAVAGAEWRLCEAEKRPRRLPWLEGIPLALVVGLSWHLAMVARRPELLHHFVGNEIVQRVAGSGLGRQRPWWFFLPVLLVGALPWTAAIVPLARAAWRRLRGTDAGWTGGLLAGWFLPGFIAISCSHSKLPTYLLPMLPALALGIGALSRRDGFWSGRWVPRVAVAATFVLATAAASAPWFDDRLGGEASIRPLARILQAQPDVGQARLFLAGTRAHGIEFYMRRLVECNRQEAPPLAQQSRDPRLHRNLKALASTESDVPLYAISRNDESFSRTLAPAGWREVARHGGFILSKREAR